MAKNTKSEVLGYNSKVPFLKTIFVSALGKHKRWPKSKMQKAAGSLHLRLAAAVEPEIGIICFIHTWTSYTKWQLDLNTPTNASTAENV